MPLASPPSPDSISVLVADSNQMQGQLLVSALRRRPEFSVSFCGLDLDQIIATLNASPTQVAVINANDSKYDGHGLTLVRRLHLAHPQVAKILLLDTYDRELVLSAFRSGVRGLFCFSQYPFRLLCKCIHRVRRGEVWLNNQQTQYLIESVTQVPSLRVVNASGLKLLTPREEQVVALVADGLSNREIAHELNLSEHTVKKYLFRIFEKLGISSRVELVLYAVSHSQSRPAEWLAGA
ncbi:MAG TPA: response regulator transcription factor [Terriglobales bacterium]|nr:response regulator transcription factor [Terriglobales bacterium]